MRGVGRRKEEGLESRFIELQAQWPSWVALADRLRKSGLEPTSVRELRTSDRRSSWIVLAQPADHLVKHFELAPEVLVLCSPWDEMQANDIRWAEETFREEVRVDPGFALVIAHDAGAEKRLGAVVPEHRRYVFVQNETFQSAGDPQTFLHAQLRDALGRRRLFDLRSPATGPQFFGRERELEALERDLLAGHSLGVFGLRKVGKTSLLRRLAEKFRDAAPGALRVLPVEVDLLEIPFHCRNRAGAAGLIGRQLDRALERAGIWLHPLPQAPEERLDAAVDHVERALGARLTLILDEYEVLLGGKLPLREGIDLLDWLRGLAQSRAKAFNLVLAGRNSRLLAPARIDGVDNPMFRFLRSVPLSGLSPEECRSMVRKIGGRMALRFKRDALDTIVQETGGHPGLARTLADLVDQEVPVSDRAPTAVHGSTAQRVLPRFSREVDEDMRELVNASNDLDPRAIEYLRHLAHGVPWIGGAPEERIKDALLAYGILERDTPTFRIGRLATWLRENYASPPMAAHG